MARTLVNTSSPYGGNYPEFNKSIVSMQNISSFTTALLKAKKITAAQSTQLKALAHEAANAQRGSKPDAKKALAAVGKLEIAIGKLSKVSASDKNRMKDSLNNAKGVLGGIVNKFTYGGSDVSSAGVSKGKTYAKDPGLKGDLLPYLKTGGAISESYVNKVMDFDVYRMKNANTDFHQKGRAYIFISTPNLNLGALDVDPKTRKPSGVSGTTNRTSDSFFYEMSISEPYLMNALTTDGTFDPFIKLCTNTFHNINLTDTVMKTRLVGETLDGFKQILPTSYTSSTVANQLTVEFTELSGTPVLKLHKMWVDYMHNVRRGTMRPSAENIRKRIIDYLASLYYFQVAPDGETITYFAKYTGVAPIALPHSAFSHQHNDFTDVSVQIPYVFQYKEELNPDIISDFNIVSAAAAIDANISKGLGRTVSALAAGPQGIPKYIEYGEDIPRGITYPVAQQVRVEKFWSDDVGPGKASYKYKLVFF